MCIENESTGKYACSHAPYTRFTSVVTYRRVTNQNADRVQSFKSLHENLFYLSVLLIVTCTAW